MGSATYYYTVGEFLKQKNSISSKAVRISGQVAADSVEQKPASLETKFKVTDGAESLPVAYRGVVPDNFKAGADVVVEGQLDTAGIFQARSILTKCPSKYVPKN